MDPYIIGGYFAVGIIWGTTNAFMERGTTQEAEGGCCSGGSCSHSKGCSEKSVLKETGSMFARLTFLIPFIINQLGSILNNFVVAASDLSIAVPVVNCITFIVTFISSRVLKGQSLCDL